MDFVIAFRLLVAAFCIVAPSLLFIGFVRVLDRMRDDDLVNRVMERMDEQPTGAPGPAAVLTGGVVDGEESELVACSSCGLPNPGYAGYCGNCLTKLDS
ncbi:zinc ribbon domain-containing protein [Salinigranum salinum]|uniref:zinc ribbon domain-containing protein n=1 Tax=Salinigranum salinum TaxID=1364937 RepID=UPI001F04D0B0|nr:zinc ribbon domain-containing protein [Salinigranum salinum]